MRASSTPIISAIFVAGVWVGCADRSAPPTDFARVFAEHFCSVQASCDCGDVKPLDRCFASMEPLLGGWERQAIADGLEFNESCLEAWLDEIDAYPECVPFEAVTPPPCPVYVGTQEHGDACRSFGFADATGLVSDCRAGLTCAGAGVCRDPLNPPKLALGERCTEEAGLFPIGVYGECEQPLTCDSNGTLTCVETLPVGGVCQGEIGCQEGTYCRTEDPSDSPSLETPGICQPRTTEPGAPCTYQWECTTLLCLHTGTCLVESPTVCGRLGDFHLVLGHSAPHD